MKKVFMFLVLIAIAQGAQADEKSVAKKAGEAVKKGGEAAERGIEKGAKATFKGLKKAGEWVGGKLEKASK